MDREGFELTPGCLGALRFLSIQGGGGWLWVLAPADPGNLPGKQQLSGPDTPGSGGGGCQHNLKPNPQDCMERPGGE